MKKQTYSKKSRKQQRSKHLAPLLLVIAGLVVLSSLAYWAINSSRAPEKTPVEITGSPRLKVDRDKIDLGNVKLGQTVQADFMLTNVGDQPLNLSKQPYIEVVQGC